MELDASIRGARHFNKYYGEGAEGYFKGSPDYFDIESFSNNEIDSPYINPRTHKENKGEYPLSGGKKNGFYYPNAIIWWILGLFNI